MYIQCQHLIPALNAWAAREKYMTARLFATQFHGHGCMDDLTSEHGFDSQAEWVIDVIHGCLYNHALAGIPLIGAGIKCLYLSVLMNIFLYVVFS